MTPKITLLVHGPFAGNALYEIIDSLCAWPIHREIHLVFVVYTADLEETNDLLKKIENCPPYKIVSVKDLINPGFFNINRQLVTVFAGLQEIPKDHFVIKLRNDQWLDFLSLHKELEKRNWLWDEQDRFITTNCFTRRDRLYHPSDMFLCGWQPALALYYSAPQMWMTHLDCENRIQKQCSEGVPFSKAFICPEKYLFQNYLFAKGWELQYTESDSYNALKRYFHLINSWEICLRWKKDRTPYKGPGAIILPQYWKWPPFSGVEDEEIACYLRSDFEGIMTKTDKHYLAESKRIWSRYEKSLRIKSVQKKWTKKSMVKKGWKIAKQVIQVVFWFFPYGLVLLLKWIWHTETSRRIKTNIKKILYRLLR